MKITRLVRLVSLCVCLLAAPSVCLSTPKEQPRQIVTYTEVVVEPPSEIIDVQCENTTVWDEVRVEAGYGVAEVIVLWGRLLTQWLLHFLE